MAKTKAAEPELIDPNVEISSVDQLPAYLQLIKHLQLRSETVSTAEKKAVEKAKERFASRRLLMVQGAERKLTEYVAELEDRVIDYARNNADKLFSEKVKTYQCEGGAISSRKQPEQVGFVNEDDDDEKVATRIIEQADLLPEFDRLRAEFANVFPYLRIRLSLDRAGMVAAYRDRTLPKEDLEKRGLTIVRDPTKYTVKTA